jgi:hypothetical protein
MFFWFNFSLVSEVVSQNSKNASENIDRKKDAIAAVSAAKKDLLKHSLDMMVNIFVD